MKRFSSRAVVCIPAVRVLVVEDEARVRSFLVRGLEEAGFAVDAAASGDEGLRMAFVHPYDALVLDLGLPGMDGLSVLRELRAGGRSTPVLILSAREELEDRVRGLDAGADDYLPKPFAFAELLARLRALLRRGTARASALKVADLEIDLVTRTMIAEHVWDLNFDSFSNVIDVYIRYLRRKIDETHEPKLIHTRRGVGYVLTDRP